ncbi:MAG TPA: carboxypeptidase regulatory-like domain-containing protein [Polyangia bacterium]|nr:carboxypeptidase regulatory-like domain-containing protein [Polyangia bacterium]
MCAVGAGRAAPPGRGSVAGLVSVRAGGGPRADRSSVVVYLEKVPGPAPDGSARGAQIRQRNQTFVPDLAVVQKGEKVEFPNEDKVFHNVFSVSRVARFDLGLYKSGTSKSVTLPEPGVVDVYCNIHPQMVAKIKVLDSGYYAITAPDGRFRIDNVPEGTYPIVAWQAYGDEYRGQVTVSAGGTTQVAIDLSAGEVVRRHLRKDGTPYGRYK